MLTKSMEPKDERVCPECKGKKVYHWVSSRGDIRTAPCPKCAENKNCGVEGTKFQKEER
jgi:hypothetical protein